MEFRRGKSLSLKTQDSSLANKLFKKLEKQAIEQKLQILDNSPRLVLETFRENYLSARSHLSGSTTKADELALRLLGDVVGHSRPLKLINKKAIQDFITVCSGRGLTPDTINTYLRHIKAALREGLGPDKAPKIKFLPTPKRLPKTFEMNDLNRILDHIKLHEYELWRIVEFGLWTATRRSEILNLQWTDVRADTCRIIGKGDKERWVDLMPAAIEAMGPRKDIGRVFCKYHKDTVSHRFKKYLRQLKIDGHFHMLRHTSATAMLNSGIPLPVIQSILGHVDIRTTQIYAQVCGELRKQEMQKLKF